MPRPLGTHEHCYWLLGRSTNNHIVYAAEIDGIASPQAWRAAFDALQHRHPLLRVRIPAMPDGFPYAFPYFDSVEDRPIPVHVTDDVPWHEDGIDAEWLDREIARELIEPVDHDRAPLMRAIVASDGTRSLLIVAGSHAIFDGIGLAGCIRDVLRALAGQTLAPLPVPPSLNQLLGVAVGRPPTHPPAHPPVRPPARAISPEVPAPPHAATPVVHRLRLSRTLTGVLRIRARAAHATVHGALCAAMLLTGRAYMRAWQDAAVKVVSPIDLRRQFGTDEDCAVYVTVGRALVDAQARHGFWDMARHILHMTDVPGTRASVRLETRDLRGQLADGLDAAGALQARRIAHSGAHSNAHSRDLIVSNLGPLRFGARIGPYRMTALWGPFVQTGDIGDHMLGAATVDGSLHLSLTSATPEAAGWLEAVKATLEAALQACPPPISVP
ncbi:MULTISPECIES: phthiocerol/phthiodiolone dimycocerosyl transferase family protein [unclassified Cupriavidus]|uniref:phthiocerol/phthiodiolone dimycocerosyl transferase family protein n=1 Tax=unclassified Cupriavidus TaxID=2640874 RepID=UPI00313AD436